jgi:hypothetical protein
MMALLFASKLFVSIAADYATRPVNESSLPSVSPSPFLNIFGAIIAATGDQNPPSQRISP